MSGVNATGHGVHEVIVIGPGGTPAVVQGSATGTPIRVTSVGQSGTIVTKVTAIPKSALTIVSASKADPTVVTTETHSLTSGQTVVISNSDSVPRIDGSLVVTVTAATTFTVPVNVNTGQTFTIAGNTIAAASVVTVAAGHLLKAGTTAVTIAGSNSTPVINGAQTATYINATTFSVAVNVTVAGTAGTVNYGRAGTGVGTIAVPAQPVPTAALAGRVGVRVQNVGSTVVYIGAFGVTPDTTATGGSQLAAGVAMDLPLSATAILYAASAVAGGLVSTLET